LPRCPLIHDVEVGEFAEAADRFQGSLAAHKAAARRDGFDWYPYDSFGAISLLPGILSGHERWLRTLAGDEPVMDVGCGDGSLSFLLESLGMRVYAIDNPAANYNRMRGVQALKAAMHSSVRIASVDLDANAEAAFRECSLALFLGVLYHLKNPFG
jgi:2-polyprenyl-3-methyl-5-hydroxy-6-metoxy-1,4-benzoquinol methylase